MLAYARAHPDIRHRELAWRMVDDNVACISASSVYSILREANLICRWTIPERRPQEPKSRARRPDERWESDIRYVAIGRRKYYLISFMDEYSRYVAYHELMPSMDGNSVAFAADRGLRTLNAGRPIIQTDNGSGYISREFKMVLNDYGLGHQRIHPHCPEENGMVERMQRTIKEYTDQYEFENVTEAKNIIATIIEYYNIERLHSALNFLRPFDYYRGDPQQLLEERRIKIIQARHRRREQNLKISNHSLPFIDQELHPNHKQLKTGICPV